MTSSRCELKSGVMLSMSLPSGFGDSNVELGSGSMTGMVQINKEAGTV